MSVTWHSKDLPAAKRITAAGWLRVAFRGSILACMILTGLIFLLLIRVPERPLHRLSRPWSPHVVRLFSRLVFVVLGMRYRVVGQPMAGPGAMVSNHASWLDIFVLNARACVTFVSKAEVARWPGIGFLARITGTLFIHRAGRQAGEQRGLLEDHLRAGHRLVFFPEGTSTDGLRVLPFKSTLFAALFTSGLPHDTAVQPVTVRYIAPAGEDPRFYGWWGDMGFGAHLLKLLAQAPQGGVEVTYHAAIPVSGVADRKALARASEAAVRGGRGPRP
ncbi:lysophospholipid acyltransferase family protein [Psychromarinibacter sp. C21-152]|uniref:Lysophospholipid acyltransferase family protein n=1 Tax=Psychromarinibacter sediminicola TaxID=3033385 RepID=A0AAE3NR57_9RHOB|nr:lysophospholipid acyltransferase family protein [Psychromarinibacter sediminicola]MDF0600536.1 lysophospholipid acyltransferase family protein [Psychromarinibacter sediminicola]